MMLPLNQAATPLLVTSWSLASRGGGGDETSMIGPGSGALFRIAQFAK
jgi:hypothetical protein